MKQNLIQLKVLTFLIDLYGFVYNIADNGNRYNYKGYDITDNSSNDIESKYE